MTRQIKAGSTDVSVVIRIVDSADGTPETGVVFNTSGLDLEYRRELAASVDITEATLAALTTAHSDGGFLHIGNGYYRLDLPDAAVAAGAMGVLIHGTCTGMVIIGEYIELVAYDPYDTVRMGLTALPNAAAEAAGGLFTRGTGAGQINQAANGRVDVNAVALSGDATAANNAESFFDGTGYAGTNNVIPTVTTLTGHTPQTGDSYARLGAPAGASIAADIAAIEAQTDDIGAAGAGLTGIPWNAAWDAEVQSEVQDAIEANHLDHLLANTYDPASKPGAADALLNELVESDGGVARFTANALEQAPTGGGSGDWTATEKEHIRYRLQIDGTQTAPAAAAPTQLPVDVQGWAGDTPNPLINGRVDTILGAFLIDESRVDGACTEGGETQSFTTNLTETEDDYYAGWVFMFTDAGVNQAVPRVVRLYNGTTKEITLITPLPASTTNGHAFSLVALTTGAELTDGSMALNKSYTSSAVLDAEQAGFLTPGTIGESINEAATNTGLTAQDVRDAMKLAPSGGAPAGGSIDDMVATVETNTQNIETDTGTDIPALIAALNDLTSGEVGDAVLDEVVEGSLTLRHIMRLTLAALANKAAGGGTTTITFRDLADSKARISATVDANGNRTAVTLDGS